MTREKATEHNLLLFVKPVITSVRDLPQIGESVVKDVPALKVILRPSIHEINAHPEIRRYLGTAIPKAAVPRPSTLAPIVATYVGIPRFVANPDGLIVTNALYKVIPRREMSQGETRSLVDRLNLAVANLPKPRYAERWTPKQMESLVL